MTESAWQVRALEPRDLPQVVSIQQACPEAAQWSAADYEPAAGRGVYCLIADQQGRIGGFLAGRVAHDQFEILNLAVREECRRAGIATQLLNQALGYAAAKARQAFLEVRPSNRAARQFYARHGFVQAGRRRAYYANPVEDALILARGLGAGETAR